MVTGEELAFHPECTPTTIMEKMNESIHFFFSPRSWCWEAANQNTHSRWLNMCPIRNLKGTGGMTGACFADNGLPGEILWKAARLNVPHFSRQLITEHLYTFHWQRSYLMELFHYQGSRTAADKADTRLDDTQNPIVHMGLLTKDGLVWARSAWQILLPSLP